MSTVYSGNIRVEIKGRDVEVTIFGELESIRLLDSFLLSRIAGLSRVEQYSFNNILEAVTYEDATGMAFGGKNNKRP